MEKVDSPRAEKTAFMVLFAISLAHMLNDAVQSVVPSIYPIIKEDFGLTFAQIGIVTFVFQMTSSILQPVRRTLRRQASEPVCVDARHVFHFVRIAFAGLLP